MGNTGGNEPSCRCQIDMVETGFHALHAVERNEYDLVFMDCHMPRMDGFEATRRIRQIRSNRYKIPVVALTAAALSEERQQCEEAGMDDFLSKLVLKKDLECTLHKWLPTFKPT